MEVDGGADGTEVKVSNCLQYAPVPHPHAGSSSRKGRMIFNSTLGDENVPPSSVSTLNSYDFQSMDMNNREASCIVATNLSKSKEFSEISSCSYEARASKVCSGMLVNRAVEFCPELVCLPYAEFEEYRQLSRLFYSIVAKYTLSIKAVSCDEMFTDLTDLCQETGIYDPMQIVSEIRSEILDVLKCSASAGLGSNILLARLATRKAKPNGQYWIREEDVPQFMMNVNVRDLPGVGYATIEKLQSAFEDNAKNCEGLQQITQHQLQSLLGQKLGAKIFHSCRGISIDEFEATEDTIRKSVSCDVNFGIRLQNEEDLNNFLGDISSQLALKLDALELSGSNLTLRLMIRCPDAPIEHAKHGAHGPCDVVARSVSLLAPVFSCKEISRSVLQLSGQLAAFVPDIRGIGIQMTRLSPRIPVESQATIKNFLRVRKLGSDRNLVQGINKKEREQKQIRKPMKRQRANQKEIAQKRFGQLPMISTEFSDYNWLNLKYPVLTEERTIWIHSTCISYCQVPKKDTIQRLLRYYNDLIDQANFFFVKSSISFVERTFLDSLEIDSGWLTALAALKLAINQKSLEKHGATAFT